MKTINSHELFDQIRLCKAMHLIDVLPNEFYNKRHIPTAINIPFDQIERRATNELPNKSADIVVYCSNSMCSASTQAARILGKIGYTNVVDYEAGIEGWIQEGYETEAALVEGAEVV